MNIDLRQAIYQRVAESSEQDLSDIIADSIGAEEKVLPGLGVLFEMIWKHSADDVRQQLVATLHAALQDKA